MSYIEIDDILQHELIPEEPVIDGAPVWQTAQLRFTRGLSLAESLQTIGDVPRGAIEKRVGLREDLTELLEYPPLEPLLVLDSRPLGNRRLDLRGGEGRRLLGRVLDRIRGALNRAPGLGEAGFLRVEEAAGDAPHHRGLLLRAMLVLGARK